METESYDWPAFYEALCTHGPDLLVGLDAATYDVVRMLAADTDGFWSDGLADLLAQGAEAGDLQSGVVMALDLWRENVLSALSDDFALDLGWSTVTIDLESPLIADLVEAATPAA